MANKKKKKHKAKGMQANTNKVEQKNSKLLDFWIEWKVLIVIGIFAAVMLIWNAISIFGNM